MKAAYSLLTFLSVAFVAAGPVPVKPGPVIAENGIQGLRVPSTNFARGDIAALENADLITKRAVDGQDATASSLEARHKKKKAGAAKKKGKGAAAAAAAGAGAGAAAAGNAGNATAAAANVTAAANGTATGKKHDKAKGKANGGGLGGLLGNLLGGKGVRTREVRRSLNVWEAEAMRDAVGP